jgi:hypothetical protein
MLSSFEELGLNWLAHVVDEKPIPPFKTGNLWAMDDSIPDLVLNRFLLGSYPVPSPLGVSKVSPAGGWNRFLGSLNVYKVYVTLGRWEGAGGGGGGGWYILMVVKAFTRGLFWALTKYWKVPLFAPHKNFFIEMSPDKRGLIIEAFHPRANRAELTLWYLSEPKLLKEVYNKHSIKTTSLATTLCTVFYLFYLHYL